MKTPSAQVAPCDKCGYKHGVVCVPDSTDPVLDIYKKMFLCSACHFTAVCEWILQASSEDLLLKVNYDWNNKVLEQAYRRRLAGEPFYVEGGF